MGNTKDKIMFAEAYASGVLKPETHGRLVADIDTFARDAAIQKSHIWTSLVDVCSEDEIDYVKAIRRQAKAGSHGLVITGVAAAKVHDRFAAIAGFLVRNFIRARVLTLGQWLSMETAAEQYSVLLVPNFFVSKSLGGDLPAWKAAALLDMLQSRHVAGLQTIVYVSNPKALAVEYGAAFKEYLDEHYSAISV